MGDLALQSMGDAICNGLSSNFLSTILPSYLGAVGGAGAFLFLVYDFVSSRRRRRSDERSEQARQIRIYRAPENQLHYFNLSTLPVTDVYCELVASPPRPSNMRELMEWANGKLWYQARISRLVPTGAPMLADVTESPDYKLVDAEMGPHGGEAPIFRFRFTDNRGVRWQWTPHGVNEVPDTEPDLLAKRKLRDFSTWRKLHDDSTD